MFYALPAETVFEAKERTKRATVYLFILLCGFYIFFINLMTVSGSLMLRYWTRSRGPIEMSTLIIISSALGISLAVGHFLTARSKTLDDFLEQIGTKPADPQDAYHVQFIDIVQEVEAATGIRGIRPVVLSSSGCNAFSIQDGKGRAAIGVTEGLLSKLTRNELSSVIAHEAAHLVHEDSRLVTTCCFLSGFFENVNEAMGKLGNETVNAENTITSHRDSGFFLPILVFWIISGFGYLMTKLIFMAISRQREYLADADGVRLCKDPLSLSESIYKIAHRYRGDVPNAYEALFIVNPSRSSLDEREGMISDLFSTHPPISQRLQKLLQWAKSDMQTLLAALNKEENPSDVSSSQISPEVSPANFMIYQVNQWVGPYNPLQLLSLGYVTPSTWVCAAGTQNVLKASEVPEFLSVFEQKVQGTISSNQCPRCKVPLLKTVREGAHVEQCGFCKGYLMGAGILERLIARNEETPSLEEIKKAKIWRDSQKGPLIDRDHFPLIKCPECQSPMGKGIHSMLTQVVIDRCTNDHCRAIWCDGGELETILMLIQDAQKSAV